MDDEIPKQEREALIKIAAGAVITSGGISIQRVLITTLEFVLARGLGPVLYGVYAFAWRIAHVLFRLVNLGAVRSLQRFIPEYYDESLQQGQVAGLAYTTTVVVGVILASGLIISANAINAWTVTNAAFPPTIQLFGLLVLLVGIVRVHAGLLRSVGSAKGSVLFNKIFRPFVRLVGAGLALALGYSVIGVAGMFVAGFALLAIGGYHATRKSTGIRPTFFGVREQMKRYYNHSVPLALSSIGKIFVNRVDVILIGLLLTAEAAGIYNVALVLIAITWIPLRSFNQLLPPIAAELYTSGETQTLSSLYNSVTRLVVTFVLPIVSIQLVYGRELLAIFGPLYMDGYFPLVFYLGGVVIGSAVGATGWLLVITDHQYIRLVLDWVLAVANVVLTYVLVLEFGLIGAALGTSMAIGIQNFIQAILLRRYEGLWPFDISFAKPAIAALVMAIVMYGIRLGSNGIASLLAGGLIGLLTYGIVLSSLGINPRDKFIVQEVGTRYLERIVTAI